MCKHLGTATFIALMIFFFVSLPSSAGPDPVYQHASDCPCDDCVAKRESPASNNETTFEDVVDSWAGAFNFLYNPINTTWDYLSERWDDYWEDSVQTVPYVTDPEHIPFN